MSEAVSRSSPVVLIGSACIDIRGQVEDGFAERVATPGRVRTSLGGTARNIAENLARLDMPTLLLTALGDDPQGHLIAEQTCAAGVQLDRDLIPCVPEQPSGSYLALYQSDGALLGAIDDTTVMRAITPRIIHRWRSLIHRASFVVLDATLRPESIATVVRLCQHYGVPLCLEPVSTTLARRLLPFLSEATLLTPNMAEAAILTGRSVRDREEALLAARALQERGAETAIITMAGAGVVYASPDTSGHVPAIQTEVVNPAGAGDALTAGVIFGILNDIPLDDAIQLGAAMASMTLLAGETVCRDLTLEQVYAHLQA